MQTKFFFVAVLNRIKANLVNTTIRLEFILPKSERGIAIIITIKRFVSSVITLIDLSTQLYLQIPE